MPTTITPVDAFTTPVTSIADGEDLNQANLAAAVQQMANRTLYNSNRLGGFKIEAIQGGGSANATGASFIEDVWLTIASITLPTLPTGSTVIANGIYQVGSTNAASGEIMRIRLTVDGTQIGPVAQKSVDTSVFFTLSTLGIGAAATGNVVALEAQVSESVTLSAAVSEVSLACISVSSNS